MIERTPDSPWSCPVCSQRLLRREQQYRCADGHCFDIAKEGYVNLLPPNRRHSKDPGDDRQMLTSRRAFLERGYYLLLAEYLGRLCIETQHDHPDDHFSVLDIGCGEGYYTGFLEQEISAIDMQKSFSIAGVDISKHAVRMAAKRYPLVDYAVASSAALPVAEKSIHCLLRIFAPGGEQEIRRVLAAEGLYVRVTPGPRHLYGLRALIYDRPREHTVADIPLDGMSHIKRDRIQYESVVQGVEDIACLFRMTPYFWQATKACQERIMVLSELEVELDFYVDVYRC